jgi:hypothetical protein
MEINIKITHHQNPVKTGNRSKGSKQNKYFYFCNFIYEGKEIKAALDFSPENKSLTNLSFNYAGENYVCAEIKDLDNLTAREQVPFPFLLIFKNFIPEEIKKSPREMESRQGYKFSISLEKIVA